MGWTVTIGFRNGRRRAMHPGITRKLCESSWSFTLKESRVWRDQMAMGDHGAWTRNAGVVNVWFGKRLPWEANAAWP